MITFPSLISMKNIFGWLYPKNLAKFFLQIIRKYGFTIFHWENSLFEQNVRIEPLLYGNALSLHLVQNVHIALFVSLTIFFRHFIKKLGCRNFFLCFFLYHSQYFGSVMFTDNLHILLIFKTEMPIYLHV